MPGINTNGLAQITPLTGNERIPADTELPNGEVLQSGYISTGQLGLAGFGATTALTDGATIATNAALGNSFSVTLGGNRTLSNPTGAVAGGVYRWFITQDGTGSRTLTLGSAFKTAGGAPTPSTAAGAIDELIAYYDGTTFWGVYSKAFA